MNCLAGSYYRESMERIENNMRRKLPTRAMKTKATLSNSIQELPGAGKRKKRGFRFPRGINMLPCRFRRHIRVSQGNSELIRVSLSSTLIVCGTAQRCAERNAQFDCRTVPQSGRCIGIRGFRGGLSSAACVIVQESMRDIDLPRDRARSADGTRDKPDSVHDDVVSLANMITPHFCH